MNIRKTLLCFWFFSTLINAQDFRLLHPYAWKTQNINTSVTALYGKEKFATIKETKQIELIVPQITILDSLNIPILIKSYIKAKSVALFQDKEKGSLIIVFDVSKEGMVDYEFNIRKEIRGTLFAVIEGIDNRLYYSRAYIDVLCLPCMSAKEYSYFKK